MLNRLSFHLTDDVARNVPRDLGGEELVQAGSSSVCTDRGARLEGLEHERLLRVRALGRVHVHGLLVHVINEVAIGASIENFVQLYLIREAWATWLKYSLNKKEASVHTRHLPRRSYDLSQKMN